jgi:lipid II:glycine glycyltransferase (peptidoglycan interpeptide bridge formation enzyme)
LTNKEQYSLWCSKRTDIPVFLRDWWLNVVCDNWDIALVMNGDSLAGVWPYPIEQKGSVTLHRNPKLTPYLGPHVFYPNDLKEANKDGFEHDTIAALLKQMPNAKVWDLAVMPGLKQAGLFKNAGLETSTRQTFLLDIHPDEAALLGNMKESLRRNIKGADFTIINDTSLLPLLHEYHKQTLNKKDVAHAYSLNEMQRLMDACVQHNAGTLWVVKEGSELLAIIWNVWDAESSYYFMGAQKPGNDNYKAMPALLWKCIQEAKRRENKLFDFEGSMDAGVEKFFRSFGADRELYLVLKKRDSLLWRLKELIR